MALNINTVASKISLGHIVVMAIIAISVMLIRSKTEELLAVSEEFKNTRAPTVHAAAMAVIGIADAQSSIRSWLIQRDAKSNQEFNEAWTNKIDPSIKSLSALSEHWVRRENIESFHEFSERITELKREQQRLQQMPVSQRDGALNALNRDIGPQASYLREQLETIIANQSVDIAEDLRTQSNLIEQINLSPLVLLVATFFMSLIIAYLIVRSVSRPLGHAIGLADAIAGGDYGTKIKISGTEEISRLGAALEHMRESLETQTWLHQAQIKFHEVVQGVAEVRDLANAISSVVAQHAQAVVSAFYVNQDDRLCLAGGYALPQSKLQGVELRFGEGIAGQAARQGRPIAVRQPGNDDLPLSTVIGDVKVKEITAVPLVYKDDVVGVIELATLEACGEREQQLLSILSQSAAIALNATQAGEQVRNLLAETQTQAEELQAQQEELRNSNDELQTRQEELEATNEELEEQKSMLEAQKKSIDLRNSQLEDAKRALAERAEELDRVSKYKSEFLANMSHELRTPLNSQLILSKLLLENKAGHLTDKEIEFARTIHSSGLDLLQLINDILDLSKVEAGKLNLELHDVSLAELARNWERDLRPVIEEKGLTFTTRIDPSLPKTIHTDSFRLGQILKNLLSNAIKFTAGGEITLRIERPSARFKGKTSMPLASAVAFHITDTGIGIPAQKQKDIFDAFVQVDSSTSREYGGTGLGLAISRGLANLLGGEICLKSEVGKGSTFTVILPEALEIDVVAPSSQSLVTEVPSDEGEVLSFKRLPNRKGLANTVLIIEDDPHFALALSNLAAEAGLETIVAEDGGQGLEYARSHGPSCILLDYRLPGIDGLQVLRELKRDPSTRHIPVHMISVVDHSREAMELGAVGYLMKPADPVMIAGVLERLETTARNKMKRILVVDDDKLQRSDIVDLIGKEGVAAVCVESAEEAYYALKNDGSFDCIILDLKLPDMSGFELLNKIHSEKEMVCPPVVIYTAKELNQKEEEMLRKYSDSIIIKGVRSSERLLDEVSLFIHRIVRDLPTEKQKFFADLYQSEKLFSAKKILLVDDDVRNIFALTSALEGKGITVSIARNGEEALQALAGEDTFDLILMDIMMPVMDGYEAMRKIRAQEKYRDLPVVALTAKAMKGDKEACLEAGASDYISKPVDVDRLFTLMRVWLSK